ncbi:hypothetical protein Tco_1580241, partial [Tanacetum coccineum]
MHSLPLIPTGGRPPPPATAAVTAPSPEKFSGKVFVSLGLHSNKGVYGFVISTKEGALGLKPPQHHLSQGEEEKMFGCHAHQGCVGLAAVASGPFGLYKSHPRVGWVFTRGAFGSGIIAPRGVVSVDYRHHGGVGLAVGGKGCRVGCGQP